jgi:glycosyltransferase involved in cell wall biosynthesis
MRKKRILFCTEATFLNTGYSTYTREVMRYLHSTGKYELAEMAAYGQRNDPRGFQLPWKYYGVQPNRDFEPVASREEMESFESNPINQFGAFIFEDVCLDFKPDIVFDIRDFWMIEFVERSPFRNYFKWVIMPTVDAEPQARQWIATFKSADAVFTYSEWAGEVIKNQSGDTINYLGTAPPSANEAYAPMDKGECRTFLGLDKDIKIVGTVMRNQRRKLYPDLFKAFSLFLSQVENPEQYKLYCHTSYPDLGWDIPELLLEYGLSSDVYFTYQCPETNKVFASLFAGAVCESPFTGNFNATMCNVRNGASYEQLAKIINCFDLYVQYANSEGFGLPQVEAAACGIPVMATDYSAMKSVVRNLCGRPIEVESTYKELETGCLRAKPSNKDAANGMLEFFTMSEERQTRLKDITLACFKEYYQWDLTGSRLEKCFDEFEIIPDNESWGSAPKITNPKPLPSEIGSNVTHKQLAQWLIVEVLGEPDKINSYFESRLIRDLMYGQRTSTVGGMYHNESSAAFDGKANRQPFNLQLAYEEMVKICQKRNYWENKRVKGK